MGWHWDSIFMITLVSSKFQDVRINLLHSEVYLREVTMLGSVPNVIFLQDLSLVVNQ